MDIRYHAERAERADRARRRILREGRTPDGRRLWSREEEAFVRRHYPDVARIQRRFQHRTTGAIRAKAFKLGLTRKSEPWTGAKILLLRKVWGRGSRDDVRKAFPECSWQRLYDKACSLRLRRPHRQPPAKHRLLEEIRARGRALDLTLTDIDRLTNHRSGYSSARYTQSTKTLRWETFCFPS